MTYPPPHRVGNGYWQRVANTNPGYEDNLSRASAKVDSLK